MSFADGYLGLLSALGLPPTEMAGVTRQAMSFSEPSGGDPMLPGNFGVSRSRIPFRFPASQATQAIAGLGLWDAPASGNLLLIMAFGAPPVSPGGGMAYAGDTGFLHLNFSTDFASQAVPEAYSAQITPGGILGSFYDDSGIIGSTSNLRGQPIPLNIISGTLTAGVGVTITRGVLRATSTPA